MFVSTKINERIFFIEMQDEEHLNCLSEGMCAELIEALQRGYDSECVGNARRITKARRLTWIKGFEG